MAPLSSPDGSQSRFGGGLCSRSMAPALPASGFAFPHLQRLLQSSAADSSFQIQEQVGQFYLPQKTQAALGHASAEAPRSGSSSAENAVADPARDPAHFQSYGHEAAEGAAILPTLMRYHSAPSSVLANLAGMVSTMINPTPDYGQFLPNNMVAELNPELKRMGKHSLDHIDSQASMGAAAVDQLENRGNEFVAAQGPYQQPGAGDGELLSQRSVGADNVPLLRSPGAPSEVGKAALRSPNRNSRFMYSKQNYEDGLQRMPLPKDGLLRHSSSPPGFFAQLNDEQERHILASSSGNSEEEGNYERQGCHGLFNGCPYDDTGNMAAGHVDGSPAARKRVRDLSGKNYSGSTFLESQKPDAFGNYFGMPITGSPENTYLTEKVSSDSILCRTRAKRGCATHPRSIAERVRRTKISERMKKLQELVPHMDKQANYAEMLDEAVEYVKCLQRQVKELLDNQSKCNCACGKPKETISSSK